MIYFSIYFTHRKLVTEGLNCFVNKLKMLFLHTLVNMRFWFNPCTVQIISNWCFHHGQNLSLLRPRKTSHDGSRSLPTLFLCCSPASYRTKSTFFCLKTHTAYITQISQGYSISNPYTTYVSHNLNLPRMECDF